VRNVGSEYASRGYILYDARKYTVALSDYRKVIELDPSNSETSEYSRFRIWLIRSRQGDEKGATQELLAYIAKRKPGDPPDWPFSVMRYLAGQLPEAGFFASAKNADPKRESEHMCEAYYYSGSRHLFAGDNQVAIEFFRKCIATAGDHRDFCEYISALAELKILETPKK
jgi:lipoprotein NlpI